MRVKQRSVCQNCRSRKLGCDGKSPECSQCLLTGRRCPGYPVNWSFVQSQSKTTQSGKYPSNVSKQDPNSQEDAREAPHSEVFTCQPSNGNSLLRESGATYNLQQVDLIIRSYVPNEELDLLEIISNEPRPRICGSWVEILPALTQISDSNIISAASKALFTSIMSQRHPERVSGVDSTRSYLAALQLMQKELSTANASSDKELLASIMCLSLAEVMFPGPTEGIRMHIDAVAQILQSNGPQRYQTGVAHRLFAGFRPLLMINAIQSRTPSFLGSDNWKTTPFAILSPSPMQSLLSEAAALPLNLHRLDKISGSNAPIEDQYEVTCILNSFEDLLSSLNEWEASESNNATSPLYWYRDQDTQASTIPCIWFPSITMANAITHIWTFRIICLYEMERLASSLPQPNFDYLRILKEHHIKSVQQSSENMMRRICESMEYLLQEEMKLFGPASTILPLQVAYAVATVNGNHNNEELAVLKKIVNRLDSKGLQSFPTLIFERNPFLYRWDTLSSR